MDSYSMKKLILALIPGAALASLPPQRCTGLNYIQCLPGEKINASSIALGSQVSGTLPVANGGSGVTSLSNILGTTDQVTVSGGTARVIGGNVTLSLPQSIASTSSPTFAGMTLTGFSGVCKATAGVLSASTIVNADINASAAIVDTKLATISTAGKVSNSATTATNLNTASAIVARDGSGNFAAGTITAALTGNASTATALAANPTDCGAGTKATAIDASGNLTCSAVSLTADVSGIAPLANGGTNKNMTAVNGGVVWTDADSQEVTTAGTSGQYLKSAGAAAPVWTSFTAPTVQRFTSGSGTYTTPAGVLYIKVRVVAGGGGGGPSGTAESSESTSGSNSTFGSSLLTANGGTRGDFGGAAGAGGSFTVNSPAVEIGSVVGGYGGGSAWSTNTTATSTVAGGTGGGSCLGGGYTAQSYAPAGAAPNAAANSGAGGSGAGTGTTTAQSFSGSGGGAGGCVYALITSPSSTYSYSVGAGGSGGLTLANGFNGGNGGSGVIIVEEYYQ